MLFTTYCTACRNDVQVAKLYNQFQLFHGRPTSRRYGLQYSHASTINCLINVNFSI